MAKLAHESSTFVNTKELQRVKKKASTQGILDAFATPRTSRTSQNSPYGSEGPSQGPVEGNMGFQYFDEADSLAMDQLEDSCAGFLEDAFDEPEVKIRALRKTLTWAAGVIKEQIKEKTEMPKDKFLQSNDKGDVWSSDKQWAQVGSAIQFGEEGPQSYDQYSITSMDDFRVKLIDAHDSLFYTATGLNVFTDEEHLGVKILGDLYGEPMASKILQEKDFTTRPEVREMLMYLLYFGIGGKPNSCAKYMRSHLNGRVTPALRDPCLNHFVTGDKAVQTCVFKLEFSHNPSETEQVGIDFVTTTKKQTNIKLSSADKDEMGLTYFVIYPHFGSDIERWALFTGGPCTAHGPKARALASGNKNTPCKANSRQKKYYGVVKDHFSTGELGRRGHELLILLAAHASKRMDGSTGVEPANQSCLGKIYQCGVNREILRFRPTALGIYMAQAPPRLHWIYVAQAPPRLPATAPRAARGRADAAEAVGCTIVATTNLAPLASKVTPHHHHHHPPPTPPPRPPPTPFPIQQQVPT
jgi:hypothetical protein